MTRSQRKSAIATASSETTTSGTVSIAARSPASAGRSASRRAPRRLQDLVEKGDEPVGRLQVHVVTGALDDVRGGRRRDQAAGPLDHAGRYGPVVATPQQRHWAANGGQLRVVRLVDHPDQDASHHPDGGVVVGGAPGPAHGLETALARQGNVGGLAPEAVA